MQIRQVTPAEAKEALDRDPDAVYLDVRTEREFAHGHPAGAINIPVVFFDVATGPSRNKDFLAVAEKVLSKDKPIFCGCKSGDRSQMAAEILVAAGFTRVANVVGGFGGAYDRNGIMIAPGWAECRLPVSKTVDEERSYAGLRKKAGL